MFLQRLVGGLPQSGSSVDEFGFLIEADIDDEVGDGFGERRSPAAFDLNVDEAHFVLSIDHDEFREPFYDGGDVDTFFETCS